MKYADPMVLRGLLYQLTGDESIAATLATTAYIRDSKYLKGPRSGSIQGRRLKRFGSGDPGTPL